MRLRKTRHCATGIALALTGLALAIPPAHAAGDEGRAANDKFNSLDANRDGHLSKSELRRFRGYGKAFDEADENRDGRLDADEFIKSESIYQRQRAATYVGDSVVTAKVKAALLKETKSLNVSVETFDGNVLLSGFVENEAQLKKALKVASSIEGVASVKNGMVVK